MSVHARRWWQRIRWHYVIVGFFLFAAAVALPHDPSKTLLFVALAMMFAMSNELLQFAQRLKRYESRLNELERKIAEVTDDNSTNQRTRH